MLSWDEAVKEMKAEGYTYEVIVSPYRDNDSTAWRESHGANHHVVRSTIQEPVAAINDLLAKCRAEWPPRHDLDDLAIGDLIADCEERGWWWCVGHKPGTHGSYRAQVRALDPIKADARTAADALRAAMKERLQRERQR